MMKNWSIKHSYHEWLMIMMMMMIIINPIIYWLFWLYSVRKLSLFFSLVIGFFRLISSLDSNSYVFDIIKPKLIVFHTYHWQEKKEKKRETIRTSITEEQFFENKFCFSLFNIWRISQSDSTSTARFFVSIWSSDLIRLIFQKKNWMKYLFGNHFDHWTFVKRRINDDTENKKKFPYVVCEFFKTFVFIIIFFEKN